MLVPGESANVEDFRRESRNAYQLLSLYWDLMAQDVSALRDRLTEPEVKYPRTEHPQTEVEKAFTTIPKDPRTLRHFAVLERHFAGLENHVVISNAAAIFEHLLTEAVRDVRLHFETFVPEVWTEDKTYVEEPEMLEHMVKKYGEKSRDIWPRQQSGIWSQSPPPWATISQHPPFAVPTCVRRCIYNSTSWSQTAVLPGYARARSAASRSSPPTSGSVAVTRRAAPMLVTTAKSRPTPEKSDTTERDKSR